MNERRIAVIARPERRLRGQHVHAEPFMDECALLPEPIEIRIEKEFLLVVGAHQLKRLVVIHRYLPVGSVTLGGVSPNDPCCLQSLDLIAAKSLLPQDFDRMRAQQRRGRVYTTR